MTVTALLKAAYEDDRLDDGNAQGAVIAREGERMTQIDPRRRSPWRDNALD